jgi:hypothetical protein
MADTDTSSPILRYNLIAQVVEYFNGSDYYPVAATGGGVSSLNTLTGAITLAAGSNITLTPSGNTITIDSTGGSTPNIVSFVDTSSNLTNSISPTATATLVAITSSTGKKIKISVSGVIRCLNPSLSGVNVYLFKDGVQLGPRLSYGCSIAAVTGDTQEPCAFNYLDTAADNAAHTYQVYIANDNNSTTVYFYGPGGAGVIIAEEVH